MEVDTIKDEITVSEKVVIQSIDCKPVGDADGTVDGILTMESGLVSTVPVNGLKKKRRPRRKRPAASQPTKGTFRANFWVLELKMCFRTGT